MDVTRRRFLTQASALSVLGRTAGLPCAAGATGSGPVGRIERLTQGPSHHFFGCLYDMQHDTCTTLATLEMRDKQFTSGDLRCDFHPRWNRTDDAICFDAIEPAGTRQIHIAHLALS